MKQVVKQAAYVLGLLLSGTAGWYLAGQQSAKPAAPEGEYLATVNGQGIARDWFIEQMKLRGGLKPGQYQTNEQKKALLDYLINEEIIFQQALEQGVGDDPTVSQVYKKAVIDKFLTDTLEQRLNQLTVRESEVETHFNNNRTVYNKPARRRAAILFAEFQAQDDEAQKAAKRQRLETALSELDSLAQNITHFGALAKQYSDDRASMYQGGVIGWLINHPGRKYKWGQDIVDALFALEKPGDVSDIISTDEGFYLVRLVAAEQVKEKTFSQVKKGIKNQLMQSKRKQLKDAFMAEIKAAAEVDINDQMLALISPLSEPSDDNNKKPPAMPAIGGGQ